MTEGTLSDNAMVEKLINSAKSLNPVDGIYFVVEETKKQSLSLLASLDSVSRASCPAVRYE